jgi:hypothetical protein
VVEVLCSDHSYQDALIIYKNGIYRIKANDKNKLGKITLTAKYQNIEYTKEISIIPLW